MAIHIELLHQCNEPALIESRGYLCTLHTESASRTTILYQWLPSINNSSALGISQSCFQGTVTQELLDHNVILLYDLSCNLEELQGWEIDMQLVLSIWVRVLVNLWPRCYRNHSILLSLLRKRKKLFDRNAPLFPHRGRNYALHF